MSNTNQHLTDLFIKWIERTATAEETDMLMKLIASSPDPENDVLPLLNIAWENEAILDTGTREQKEKMMRAILRKDEVSTTPPVHRVQFIRRRWLSYAAALLVFAGVGGYLWLKPATDSSVSGRTGTHSIKSDIFPGNNKAVLTLADGSTITVDSSVKGRLATQSGTVVQKNEDGVIVYSSDSMPTSETLSFNTMSTSRGGQYQLVLPDGTKVWLNAQSSIKYPTVFNGKRREVVVKGEAFFEVAKNTAKPFIVKTKDYDIQVLGTQFNVNAYEDEHVVNTTLIDGAVKVIGSAGSLLLSPGEQSSEENGLLRKRKSVNIEEVVSWKNGYFHFESTDLSAILRQFSRWYDIDVVYDGPVSKDNFFMIIKRSSSLQAVLNGLQASDVEFEIKGNRLTVKAVK